jgi:hypothetical protein
MVGHALATLQRFTPDAIMKQYLQAVGMAGPLNTPEGL